MAKPIHGLLPYYRKQEEKKRELRMSKLRYRCQSQLLSGYVGDQECQEWISYEFINASTKSTSPVTAFSMIFSVIVTMLAFS